MGAGYRRGPSWRPDWSATVALRDPARMEPLNVPLADIDLSSFEFWVAPEEYREGAFRTLRTQEPVKWFDAPVIPEGAEPIAFPVDLKGYWSLTAYDDIWHSSRNPQLFCSSRGGVNIQDMPIEIAEFFGSMIAMDDPKHARLRGIVQRGFTPKTIAQVESYVRTKATGIVDGLLERFPDGECDFVEEVAAPLPLQVICEMMGIPESDEKQVFNWTNIILGVGDPDVAPTFDDLLKVSMEIYAYAQALGDDRLKNPKEDLTSALMHAEVDGERLTTQEFGSFFILLVVAGNETTRNAISWGMKMLTEHPDQKALLYGDYDRRAKGAVEEFVRWATPVISFRRTATADTEIGGVKIAEGDKVVYWYNSANRDERQFTDPYRFDITRDPNPHLGYGAGGPHFCLGANLARREITVMFEELARRLPQLQATGEPARLQSSFIHGIKRMPCAWKGV
jgi:methyl-branched lipid omega-hydroxylase